jgi:hypothetical protein
MDEAMPREEFIERVTEIVRDRFPLVKIGDGDGSFSLMINGSVAPLENLYRVANLRPEELQRHVERWAVELLRAAEGTPDEDAGYEEVKERIMPMVLPISAVEATPGIVHEPFVPGLIIGYAIDHDRTISYLPILKFQEWGITMDQLRETAMNNLTTKSEAISAHAAQDEEGHVNLILFQTMDGYDASRLLLPTLHERLREHLGSPFAAGIPNRDILLCFRNDAETADRLVTDKLLLVTQDGIAPRE